MADDATPNTTAANGDEKRLREFAQRAEQAARERAEKLRTQAREYYDEGLERFDEAQRYIVQRVQEKPVQSTLVAVGAGVVIGLLLAGRRR